MPDLLVRDVPSEVADALSERARAAGMDRQEWLRQHFAQLVQLPIVKVSSDTMCRRNAAIGAPSAVRSARLHA